MTDVAETVEPGTTEEQAEAVAATEPADKPAKAKAEPQPCTCSFFEVGVFDSTVGTAAEQIYSTGCVQTTGRTFAQGHDARLVSFLVDGHFDGFDIRFVKDGTSTGYGTPGEAARSISEALGVKADKATANRKAKNDAKKEKADARTAAKVEREQAKQAAKDKKAEEKAKAAEAKANTPQAEVAAGSSEGDLPELAEGQARIKVGRWEYTADIDAEGNASFVDGKGEAQVINRDGYRVL